jgi:adenylate cyclase
LANIMSLTNNNEEALPLIEQAFQLDPLHPALYDMYLGRALLLTGQYDRALPSLRNCARRAPDFWYCHATLAAALALAGQDGPARTELAEMLKYYPVKSVAAYRAATIDPQPGPQTELLYTGLEKAGLPRD